MRTHVEFRSSKFPPYEGEDEQVNPGRYGKRLAEHLKSELTKRGIATGEFFAEDWGWGIRLPGRDFKMWLGCGNYEEYADGFLCFIEPSQPFVYRWLKKIDTHAAVEQVAEALDHILRSDPDVRNIAWWTDAEKGR
jgi:hypothetical protein